MIRQDMVLALEGDRVAGFMAFLRDYTCEHIDRIPNLYASTSLVHPDFHGQKLMQRFYEAMIHTFPGRPIYTRTWHTNASHLRVLDKLGFRLLKHLENHRGRGSIRSTTSGSLTAAIRPRCCRYSCGFTAGLRLPTKVMASQWPSAT